MDFSSENLDIFYTLYPFQRKSSVNFSDIIKFFEKKKLLSKREVQLKINRSERTTRSLLNLVERMNVLNSTINNSYKVWSLNQNLKSMNVGENHSKERNDGKDHRNNEGSGKN